MDSVPSLYDNVLVLDFKSLYPSIIRTFAIDPLGLAVPGEDPIPGFEGATFPREGHILPEIIEGLWAAREDAKRRRDAARSRAIKILMNSFYGVLGSGGCRFFDPRLASSITLRGHENIQQSRALIEGRGLQVIYGDTDSLFVHVGSGDPHACAQTGAELAADLDAHWAEHLAAEYRIDSHLELEFETLYLRLLIQAARKLGRPVREIRYVITTRGAEPVDLPHGRLDHEHYLSRQLAPAADGILQFLDTSFAAVAGRQLAQFE